MIKEKEEEKVEAQETVELVDEGTNEDYKDRDDSKHRDEEETSPIP